MQSPAEPRTPDEGQIRDQLNRRGLCLLETLLFFVRRWKPATFAPPYRRSLKSKGSFREYVELCARPLEHRIMRQYELKPNPSGDARTRQAVDRKRRQSQAELIDILRQECQVNQKNAFDLMQDWRKVFPLRDVRAAFGARQPA